MGKDGVDDVLAAGGYKRLAALRAMGDAQAGVEQPRKIIDLCDGADRRPRGASDPFLFDGNGRGEPFNGLDIAWDF